MRLMNACSMYEEEELTMCRNPRRGATSYHTNIESRRAKQRLHLVIISLEFDTYFDSRVGVCAVTVSLPLSPSFYSSAELCAKPPRPS